MFVASKAPWWEIRDGLPAFDAFPPGIDASPVADRPLRDPPGTPRGSCLCGAVAFRIEGKPIVARSCHCGRCRKGRGSAHATNMLVPIDTLRFTRGEGELAEYKIPEAKFFTQTFCRICGSKAPRIARDRGFAIVPLGALDDDPGIRLQRAHLGRLESAVARDPRRPAALRRGPAARVGSLVGRINWSPTRGGFCGIKERPTPGR